MESLKALDFIKPRFDLESEERIVRLQKHHILQQLENIKDIPEFAIPLLYEKLKECHFRALVVPGECVGISGAQSMGEFGTQATLNTFHIAGFESGAGVTSGVTRFQEIINASKNQKKISCLVYFKSKPRTNLKAKLNHEIVGLSFKSVIVNMFLIPFKIENWYISCHFLFSERFGDIFSKSNAVRYVLNKQVLFQYFLHPKILIKEIESKFPNVVCVFSPICRRGKIYFDILHSEDLIDLRDNLLPKIESLLVCGKPTITSYIPHVTNDGEWFIETEGGTFQEIASIDDVDGSKISCNSIWDVYRTLGIEAAKKFLLDELMNVMTGVGVHNITLLVDKMTFNGTINGITRYTMRNEEGPFGKASFEESMETFFKAAKFGEVDNFQGISASIIGGKKPKIGTNSFSLSMDFSKLLQQ
jgi:DNA-directed RNA polymerase beta' subunit